MKTISPSYEKIKESINSGELFVKIGKKTARVQNVRKNSNGIYVYTSLGEHKVDLFTELYIS